MTDSELIDLLTGSQGGSALFQPQAGNCAQPRSRSFSPAWTYWPRGHSLDLISFIHRQTLFSISFPNITFPSLAFGLSRVLSLRVRLHRSALSCTIHPITPYRLSVASKGQNAHKRGERRVRNNALVLKLCSYLHPAHLQRASLASQRVALTNSIANFRVFSHLPPCQPRSVTQNRTEDMVHCSLLYEIALCSSQTEYLVVAVLEAS